MIRRCLTGGLAALLLSSLLAPAALACGIMWCAPPPDVPPPRRKQARVSVRKLQVKAQVDNFVARVKIEQEFENATPWELEGRYIFPLPPGASVASFAMIVDGRRIKAEVAEKEVARREFRKLVKENRDPALLEFMGEDVFQASVGPIPPGQRRMVELVYEQTLKPRGGLFELTLPLKAAKTQYSTIPVFHIEGKLNTNFQLQNLYSPTHELVLDRYGTRKAKFTYEAENMSLAKDFTLYFSASQKELGLSIMTHRVRGEDGYFMLMLTPPTGGVADTVARDVTLVADVSGSMRGPKVQQARKALDFVVGKLSPRDRFELITFSSGVKSLTRGLWQADERSKAKAKKLISKIKARGGTNIHGAMLKGLKSRSSDRPHVLVFLTDGEPTEGETDTFDILRDVRKANGGDSRIFVIGIGYNLNVKLLDGLSKENRGSSAYVKPNQKIDEEIGRWYAKVSHPVLTDLELDFGKIETEFTYPENLPDLYAGDQILLVGRYSTAGKALVKLKGRAGKGVQEHLYDVEFPDEELERDFLPRLWARRRVGYLLDKIRLLGEKAELKEEVLTLAKEYNIVTPYTSFLVRGPKREETYRRKVAKHSKYKRPVSKPTAFRPPAPSRPMPQPGRGGGGSSGGFLSTVKNGLTSMFGSRSKGVDRMLDEVGSAPMEAEPAGKSYRRRASKPSSMPVRVQTEGLADPSDMDDGFGEAAGFADHSVGAPAPAFSEAEKKQLARDSRLDLNATSGRAAVEAAERLKDMKESTTVGGDAAGIQHVGGKTFRLTSGVWVDDAAAKAPIDGMPALEIEFGSDAYFNLLSVKPGIARYLKVGEHVTLVYEGVLVKIVKKGAADLSEGAIEKVFEKAGN